MNINVFYGILIPFLGTSVGAACVIFMKKNLNAHVQRALTGKIFFCTGSGRLLGRSVVFAFAGSCDSTYSPVQ